MQALVFFQLFGTPAIPRKLFAAIETPPILLPQWPAKPGDCSVPMTAIEYACVPPGYPEVWDRDYKVRSHEYCQTFVARSRHLYGIMAFDGPKITWWGNKLNVAVYRGGVGGRRIDFPVPWGTGSGDNPSAHHTDHAFPRVGWRHGDIDLKPGSKYGVRICGYKSHGGQNFDLDTFIRPDTGDGYGPGEAYIRKQRAGGDLCLILFGSLSGQIVENHVRSEEWNIIIVRRPPTRRWGQSFIAYGVSMAGLRFWGSDGVPGSQKGAGESALSCTVRIREGGPDGRLVGPAKTAHAHDTSTQEAIHPTDEKKTGGHQPGGFGAPVVRYPEMPGILPGYEKYYQFPFDMFQVAWLPDETPLEPGKTYYVELEPSEPLMMFADGDAYAGGFGYYEGQKVEREKHLKHGDPRWTLLMDIVTYQNPRAAPEEPPPSAISRKPSPDGNLLVNGDAETGDFTGWQVGGDPMIDPFTHVPEPANHSGSHRFGISVGWSQADLYQYQEVPGITPGARYLAAMWASHQDGTDESAELLWCDGPFGGKEMRLVRTEDAPVPVWKHYPGEVFQPSASTVTIIVRYRHTRATNIASIHVDDITLKKDECTLAMPFELMEGQIEGQKGSAVPGKERTVARLLFSLGQVSLPKTSYSLSTQDLRFHSPRGRV